MAGVIGRWNFLGTLMRGTLSRVGLSEGWKKAGRDSSTAQADSVAGAKEEEKRRLASLGMTVGRVAVKTAMVVGWALTGNGKKLREIAALSTCLWVGFEL